MQLAGSMGSDSIDFYSPFKSMESDPIDLDVIPASEPGSIKIEAYITRAASVSMDTGLRRHERK
jgi:hypothetical protein